MVAVVFAVAVGVAVMAVVVFAVGVAVVFVVGRVVAAVAISGTEEVGAVIWRLQ